MNSKTLVLTLTAGSLLSFNLATLAEAPRVPATDAAQAAPKSGSDARAGSDGILKAQGSVHFRKNGQLTRVEKETKLAEGIVARPDGKITLANGTTVTLQEGQIVTLDGKVQKDTAATGATGGTKVTLPNKPALKDYGNQGADLEKKVEAQKK